MNYYTAKQRTSDGLWEYTVNNRPTGYCREYIDPDSYQDWIREHMLESEIEKIRSFKDKYHICGHNTEQEACECYKEYVLDHHLMLNRKDISCQRRCVKCNEWTQGLAYVGQYSLWFLCDKHQTREIVAELYEVGESWES